MNEASARIVSIAALAAGLSIGCDAAPSSEGHGIFFQADGEMLALKEAVTATSGSAATVQGSLTHPGLGLSSITIYFITSKAPIGPGTFDCASGVVGVIFQPGAGGNYVANADVGSCSITATSLGTRIGEITAGTFNATVDAMPTGPASLTLTDGTFKATVRSAP